MGDYILHSRSGNTFHFRKADTPDTHTEGFSVTYIPDGTTVMAGDMGNLMIERHSANGPDYGFPSKDTSLDYFEEKVRIANHEQGIYEWDAEKAKADLKAELETYEREDDIYAQIERLLEYTHRWENEHDMIRDLSDTDYDFDGPLPGMDYTSTFLRKFEMLKSVSEQVLEEVERWPKKLYAIVDSHIRTYMFVAPHPTNPHYAIYAGGSGKLPVRVYRSKSETFSVDDGPRRENMGELFVKEADANEVLLGRLIREQELITARLNRMAPVVVFDEVGISHVNKTDEQQNKSLNNLQQLVRTRRVYR